MDTSHRERLIAELARLGQDEYERLLSEVDTARNTPNRPAPSIWRSCSHENARRSLKCSPADERARND
jgi:hypothetical protein